MTRIRSFLFILCCIKMGLSGYAQSLDSTIAKFQEVGLLELENKGKYESIIHKINKKSRAAYFLGLYQIEFYKLSGVEDFDDGINIHFDKNISSAEQSNINKQLIDYLEKLRRCNLINDKQYSKQYLKVNENKYVHLLQLLYGLTEEIAYEDWLNPGNIIDDGEALLKAGLLSDESYNKLKNDAPNNNIEFAHQLIKYFKNACLFDLAGYSNDTAIYIEKIHRDASMLFPELGFTDFKYTIEVDDSESFSDYISHKLVVSLKANGKIYKQKSFISPTDIGRDDNYFGKIDEQEFYQIFNKILCDNQSPYRIHKISPTQSIGNNSSRYFGLILLNERQEEMFRSYETYLKLSYEDYKNSLTSFRIDSLIKEFQKIGILNHLNKELIEGSIQRIKEANIRTPNEILNYFPNVIYSFDLELSNLENPYKEILIEFEKISHKQFIPENIKDNFSGKKKSMTIKFDLKSNHYEKKLKKYDDWVDPVFFDFVNEVVSKNKLDGQFYELYSDGQDQYSVFLTSAQYKYLKENKILIFGNEELKNNE